MTQVPAHLANRQSRHLADTASAGLGAASPPFLSIQGNRFTLIDAVGDELPVQTYDPRIGPYLDCVLLDFLEVTSKVYYDKPFDPQAQQYEPPACFSDNGVGPSRSAARPQARTCAECPNGMWGSKMSAVTGKQVKACNDVQKIAILVPGYEMPFLLRLPPGSRTNLRGYLHKFKGQQFDVDTVITRITFEPSGIGVLKFEGTGFIDEATMGQCDKLLAAKATDTLVGRGDLPRDALPAPAALPGQAAVADKPLSNPAPFQPVPMPLAAPSAAPAPSTPPTAQPAPGAVPAAASPPPEQPRRRGRRPAQPAAQEAPAAAPAPAQPAAAPFAQPAPAPAQAPFAAPAPAASFGIQTPAAPNAELTDTLASIFGPK